MLRSCTAFYSAFLCLLLLSGAIGAGEVSAAEHVWSDSPDVRHILFLNSYDVHNHWVRAVTEGVESVLVPEENNIILHSIYMDTKRVFSPAYLSSLRDMLRERFRGISFSLIISSDDHALDFLRAHRDALWPGVPVIFCGIGDVSPGRFEGLTDYTGVEETISPKSTLELMLKVHPEVHTVFVINDYLKTGRSWQTVIEREAAPLKGRVTLLHNADGTIADVREYISSLTPGSAVLLGAYYADSTGHSFNYAKIGEQLTLDSPVPVWCLLDLNIRGGVVGGDVVSGYHQGATAARLARMVLSGIPASNIPVVTAETTRFIFDAEAMEAWGIDAGDLPSGSLFLNREIPLYIRYLWLEIGVLVLLLTLGLTVTFQARHIARRRRAENALRSAEEKYRELVQYARSIILRISPEGEILFINEFGKDYFGYRDEELVGRNILGTILPPEQSDGKSLKRLLQSVTEIPEEFRTHENENMRRDGSRVWVSWVNQALKGDDGRITAILSVGLDSTDRKAAEEELRESRRRFSTLLSNLPGMAYRCYNDDAWTMLFVSEGSTELTGYSPDAFAGERALSFGSLIHPEDQDRVWAEVQKQIAVSRAFEVEYRIIDRFGMIKWLWERGRRIVLPGGVEVLEGFMADVTQRKVAEAELARMNEELEERVKQRTLELQDSLENLRRAQRQLVESEKMASLGGLVAGIAHEINTPLGIGVTSVTFLEERLNGVESLYESGTFKRSDLEKFLRVARESIQATLGNLRRAADLVQSFKQVAVDQTSEVRRTFEMREYVEEVLQSLRPRWKRTRHTVEVNGGEGLAVDSFPGALMQVLTNLITNSLVHAFEEEETGRIAIDISEEEDFVRLVYSDNGKGMTEEQRRRIFDPFFTTRLGQGGSGLGMHIVYNLVTRKLGGTIACESAPGEGAVFTLILPKAPAEPEEKPDERHQ